MASIIKLKRFTTTGAPTTDDLSNGEVGINVTDEKIYVNNSGTIVEVANTSGSGASGITQTQADARYLQLTGGTLTGSVTFNSSPTLSSANYLQLKDSTNIIGHNGVNNLFRFTDSLQFRGDTLFFQEYDGTEYMRMSSSFGVQLKHQGSTKLQIESDGITVTGTINDHTIPSGSGTIALTSDVPTNNNELTNGAGYITGYTVTESDVTTHEAALSITESQISDLQSYLTSSSINVVDDSSTSATISNGETLKVAGATGITTSISGDTLTITGPDLSSYLTSSSFNVVDDSSTSASISTNETLKVAGATGITTSISGDTLTITGTAQDFAYSSLTGAPTNLSDFTNDAGFITSADTFSISLSDDSSTVNDVASGDTIKFAGATNITTSLSGDTLTITGPSLTPYMEKAGGTFTGDVTLTSGEYLNLGDANTFLGNTGVQTLFRFGNNVKFQGDTLFFTDNAGSYEYMRLSTSFGTQLKYQGSTKLTVDSTGITVNGQLNDLTIPSGTGTIAKTSDIPTNNNELTNGAGYITGYTVTEGDVTAHEAALSITESQITDLQSYLTSSSFTLVDDGSTSTTISNGETLKIAGATGVTTSVSGDTLTITGTAQDFAYSSLTGAPTNVSDFTNDSGFITDYTVTEADVTAHQAALSITESQISDLQSYLTSSSFSVVDDSSTSATISTNETLKIAGGTNVTTSISGDTLTINGPTLTTFGVTSTSTELNLLDGVTGDITTSTNTQTIENKTLRNPTFESGANSPEFLETRYVNATQQDFVQLYTGGSNGSYFTQGEYQKIATITPDANFQNYTFIIQLTATSASNYQIVTFTGGLRANTLPDLDFTVNYSEEHNGVRFIEPKLWTKETSTAAFILAFEYVHSSSLFGGVNVNAKIIPRSTAQRANVSFNTTQDSEQTTIDTGFTERDPTLTQSIVSGVPVFGERIRIEGATDNDFETTLEVTDPTADRTITFPDKTGTVALTSDITGSSFTIADDSSTTSTISNNETLTFNGAQNITVSVSGDTLTITGPDLTTKADKSFAIAQAVALG